MKGRMKVVKFAQLPTESQEKIEEVYYNGGKIKELLEELEVEDNYKQIYKQFRSVVLDELCEYCNSKLQKKRLARSNKSEEEEKSSIYCPICGHRPKVEKCDCQKCLEKPERKEEKYRASIQDYWDKERESVDFTQLSFRSKVFLGAVLRLASDSSMKIVFPAEETIGLLVPSGDDFLWEIMNTLSASDGALVPRSDAPINAFVLSDEQFPKRYYPVKMKYNLNIKSNSYSELYKSIICPAYYTTEESTEALTLWREIASYECVEYFRYQLALFKYKTISPKKAQAIFEVLLEQYSVSQIYYIIWSSVSTALRAIRIDDLKEKDVENFVLCCCQSHSCLSEIDKKMLGWFSRIDELPQSEISSFFFNQVVQIGEKGFFRVPNLADLEDD